MEEDYDLDPYTPFFDRYHEGIIYYIGSKIHMIDLKNELIYEMVDIDRQE